MKSHDYNIQYITIILPVNQKMFYSCYGKYSISTIIIINNYYCFVLSILLLDGTLLATCMLSSYNFVKKITTSYYCIVVYYHCIVIYYYCIVVYYHCIVVYYYCIVVYYYCIVVYYHLLLTWCSWTRLLILCLFW